MEKFGIDKTKDFEIGQKVKLKPEAIELLKDKDLGINIKDVLTVTNYHHYNFEDNGDMVELTDESGNRSIPLLTIHFNAVFN